MQTIAGGFMMASKRVMFEVVENIGPNNRRDVLKEKLISSSLVRIAVAFVTELGLDQILELFRRITAVGVGTVPGIVFTNPEINFAGST
jgi:hypothetical protein